MEACYSASSISATRASKGSSTPFFTSSRMATALDAASIFPDFSTYHGTPLGGNWNL